MSSKEFEIIGAHVHLHRNVTQEKQICPLFLPRHCCIGYLEFEPSTIERAFSLLDKPLVFTACSNFRMPCLKS